MVVRRFEPQRAVEVTSPRYGTGYRIGGRLVLTAAHLFPGGLDSACRVRSRRLSGEIEWEVDAQVVWEAQNADAALVKLPENAESVEPVVLGLFPADTGAARVSYDMYAWPEWSQTIYGGAERKAGGRHIPGEIFLADRSPEGCLVLEPERPPGVRMPGEKGSQWEGVSGAAVVSDGVVVAVQHSHQRPDRPASLEAEPISKFLDQEGFRCLLVEHGIPVNFVEIEIQKPTHVPEPPLELTRIPESARTRLNYRTRAIPFVGRCTELNQLNCFLNDASSILWWLVTGKAGSGKSRLAFELCNQLEQDWRVGFLPSDHNFQRWRDWRPTRPTLMVVNYAQSRAKEAHGIIESLYDRKESLSNPVRLLLLERSSGSWMNDLYGAGSGKLKVEASQYGQPLELNPLSQEQQWELLSEILKKWGAEELLTREPTLEELCRVDPHNRPLFVALAAHSISSGLDIGLMGSEELIADYLRREHELFWVPAGVTEQDKSLLALVTMLKTGGSTETGLPLMQTLRELSRSQAQEYLPKFAPGSAQQDIARYNIMVGIDSPGRLLPLKPDLVGEYFVLEHLSPEVDPLSSRAKSLCAEAWRLNCLSCLDFIRKAAADFPNHPSVEIMDRRWGNDVASWFVWSVGMIFREWDLAKQGKYDRILREFREILEDAPRPEDKETDARLTLALAVPDLVSLFGEADRLADAEQVYEEYSLFLRETGLEKQEESLLATLESKLIYFGCRAEDPSLFEKLWPRLLKRAQASCDLDTIAQAAWAGGNFVGCFAERNKESGLTVFGDVSKLLTAKRGLASDEDGFPTRTQGVQGSSLALCPPSHRFLLEGQGLRFVCKDVCGGCAFFTSNAGRRGNNGRGKRRSVEHAITREGTTRSLTEGPSTI